MLKIEENKKWTKKVIYPKQRRNNKKHKKPVFNLLTYFYCRFQVQSCCSFLKWKVECVTLPLVFMFFIILRNLFQSRPSHNFLIVIDIDVYVVIKLFHWLKVYFESNLYIFVIEKWKLRNLFVQKKSSSTSKARFHYKFFCWKKKIFIEQIHRWS